MTKKMSFEISGSTKGKKSPNNGNDNGVKMMNSPETISLPVAESSENSFESFQSVDVKSSNVSGDTKSAVSITESADDGNSAKSTVSGDTKSANVSGDTKSADMVLDAADRIDQELVDFINTPPTKTTPTKRAYGQTRDSSAPKKKEIEATVISTVVYKFSSNQQRRYVDAVIFVGKPNSTAFTNEISKPYVESGFNLKSHMLYLPDVNMPKVARDVLGREPTDKDVVDYSCPTFLRKGYSEEVGTVAVDPRSNGCNWRVHCMRPPSMDDTMFFNLYKEVFRQIKKSTYPDNTGASVIKIKLASFQCCVGGGPMYPNDAMPIITNAHMKELNYFILLFKYHAHKMRANDELPVSGADETDEEVSTAFVAATLVTPKKESK